MVLGASEKCDRLRGHSSNGRVENCSSLRHRNNFPSSSLFSLFPIREAIRVEKDEREERIVFMGGDTYRTSALHCGGGGCSQKQTGLREGCVNFADNKYQDNVEVIKVLPP